MPSRLWPSATSGPATKVLEPQVVLQAGHEVACGQQRDLARERYGRDRLDAGAAEQGEPFVQRGEQAQVEVGPQNGERMVGEGDRDGREASLTGGAFEGAEQVPVSAVDAVEDAGTRPPRAGRDGVR